MAEIEKLVDAWKADIYDTIISDLTALVGVGMNLGGADGEIYAEAVQECIRAIEKRKEMELNG